MGVGENEFERMHDGNDSVLVAFKIITWQRVNSSKEATERESKKFF